MIKSKFFVIFLMVLLFYSDCFSEQVAWDKISDQVNGTITQLFVDPEDDNNLLIGTEETIYTFDILEKKLNPSLIAGGSNLNVNAFEFSSSPAAEIWAATDKGLYSSLDKGRSWQKQVYSADPQSRQCFSVLYDQRSQQLYLGTASGIFIKKPATGNFEKENNIVPGQPIYKILQDYDFLYFVTPHEVIRTGKVQHRSIETIYKSLNRERNDYFEESLPRSRIKDLVIAPNKNVLLLVEPSGIYMSEKQGRQWQEIPLEGVAAWDINQMIFCPVCHKNKDLNLLPSCTVSICAATSKGVYYVQDNEWIGCNQGIDGGAIMALAEDSKGIIYAATHMGIYSAPQIPLLRETTAVRDYNLAAVDEDIKRIQQEPTIQDVHRMVIEYADVSPEKINDWKGKARMKSLLPDFSVGFNRAGTDLFHWNTGANPDQLQKGREYLNWDVSLSWDFSDLIWSSDQTSIDSRAKLMVELREDLLSQVTRVYFERRRVQLAMFKAKQVSAEEGDFYDQQLRLAELTAIIDAMTGGKYSSEISQHTR